MSIRNSTRMQVDIISPEKKLFSGQAVSVQFPGTEGRFQVLENHAPLVSTLVSGNVVLKLSDKQEIGDEWKEKLQGDTLTIDINGGVVEIRNNKVSLLAD